MKHEFLVEQFNELMKRRINESCLFKIKDGAVFSPIIVSTNIGKSHFISLHYKAAPKQSTPLSFPANTDYDELLPESIVAELE